MNIECVSGIATVKVNGQKMHKGFKQVVTCTEETRIEKLKERLKSKNKWEVINIEIHKTIPLGKPLKTN